VGEKGVCVVDTHQQGNFRPDISVADFPDDRLLYCMWYFIELKVAVNLTPSSYSGQILDYFNKAHERQRHRREFTAILSNLAIAWVFTAEFNEEVVRVYRAYAPSLADAIVYADAESRKQRPANLPRLEDRFSPRYNVLAVSKHHHLLKVSVPPEPATPPSTPTTRRTKGVWKPSLRHPNATYFVLKVAYGEADVLNELRILEEIKRATKNQACDNLPDLVWVGKSRNELGIVPVGVPIDLIRSPPVSRKIVEGLLTGLKFLHDRGIIHRDIRPSNLVLANEKVIIIDYETSVMGVAKEVEYLGGFICWPKRLLQGNIEKYMPRPQDDLFASILVVLHLLFPSEFDAFRAHNVDSGQQRTRETQRLLTLWEDIEKSKMWSIYPPAAEDKNYDKLKEMGSIFCYP
jgi:hypothetical protein